MKKKLNFLRTLVFAIVLLMLFQAGYVLFYGVFTGIKLATENLETLKSTKALATQSGTYHEVTLIPTKAMLQPDSVLNVKTEEKTGIVYSSVVIQTAPKPGLWGNVFDSTCRSIGLIAAVVAFVYFIQFISSVKRSVVFDKRNVRYLRFMGWALLVNYLGTAIPDLVSTCIVRHTVELENYDIAPFIFDNFTNLFLILGCFIIAETFTIGIKLKEEQDLTI